MRKPLRNNTLISLSTKAELLCKKLEELTISCVSNYNVDDSSDEEDDFAEPTKENIK